MGEMKRLFVFNFIISTLFLQVACFDSSTAMAAIDWATSLAKCVAPLAAGLPGRHVERRHRRTLLPHYPQIHQGSEHPDARGRRISPPQADPPRQCQRLVDFSGHLHPRADLQVLHLAQVSRGRRRDEAPREEGLRRAECGDVRYLDAMEAQLSAHSAAMRAARVRFMREKEVIRAEHLPTWAYVPLGEMEMGEECYKLYKDECARRGKVAEVLSDEVLRDVVAVYEEEAVVRHKAEFMRDAKRREEVKAWLEGKMSEMERVGDVSQANNYRFYLNLTAGGVASSPSEEIAEEKEEDNVKEKENDDEEEEEEEENDDGEQEEEEIDDDEQKRKRMRMRLFVDGWMHHACSRGKQN